MQRIEQDGRGIVGAMLRRARLASGAMQREIAIELGLVNPNFLSMIETGRYSVPTKRIADFGKAYRLQRSEILAVVKVSAPEIWEMVLECTKQVGMTQEQIEELDTEIDGVITSIGYDSDLQIV